MGFEVVVWQIGILSVIMLIGFLVAKTGYINIEIKNGISKLIINLLLPCIIISSISSQELSVDLLEKMGKAFLLSLFCISVMYGASAVITRLFRLPPATAAVHKCLSTMGNVIFIGQPIVTAMYGEDSFIFVVVYWILNDLFFWTLGILMMEKGKKKKGASFSVLFNPNTVSFVIALLMLFLGLRIPTFAGEAVRQIGSLTTPLSMVFIGMTLAGVSLKNTLKKWWVFLLPLVKLLVLPLLFLLFFRLLGEIPLYACVVLLETAMPSGMVVAIAAHEKGSDGEYAAVGMFLTTILGMATLPVICYCLEHFA